MLINVFIQRMASKAALLSALSRLDSMIQDVQEADNRPSYSDKEDAGYYENDEVSRMKRDMRRLVEEAELKSASEWSANKSHNDSYQGSRIIRGTGNSRKRDARDDDYDQRDDYAVRSCDLVP